MSEAAHLIWKIRYEWRILGESYPNEVVTDAEAANKWVAILENRIKLDIISSDSRRYKRKAMPFHLVKKTWGKLLNSANEGRLRQKDVTGLNSANEGRLRQKDVTGLLVGY